MREINFKQVKDIWFFLYYKKCPKSNYIVKQNCPSFRVFFFSLNP